MPRNIHSDNKGGDTQASSEKKNDNTTAVGLSPLDHTKDTIDDNNYRLLPSEKARTANSINFGGSSFSGSDIKVVAHLYDNDKASNQKSLLARLEDELSTAHNMVNGCTSLLNGGIDSLVEQQRSGNPLWIQDYSAKKEIFIAATGLSPIDSTVQQAINTMVGGIFNPADFSFLGGEKMKRSASELKFISEADVTGLTTQVEQLGSVHAASSVTVTLESLQTLSVQSFREKHAVRAMGHAYPKGYTRGARTIAGSMIFTIFEEHPLAKLIRAMGASDNYGTRDSELTSLLPDQIPPVDLTIAFANEYGALSEIRLFGVEWVTDGSVYSIEDLLSEETMNFVCRDADVLTARGRVRLNRLQRGMHDGRDNKDVTGSSLLFNNDNYIKYLDKLGVRRRITNR